MKTIYVINSRGEKEPFSFHKVFRSARRAGASSKLAFEIAKKIEEEIYPEITTKEIFKKVKRLLKKKDFKASLRFSLREGIRKLGPNGFPFEKYIGEIFSELGFDVSLNLHLKGKCARYEIDFLAKREDLIYVGECKYRINQGERIDLRVALENWARFLDLKEGYLKQFSKYQVRPILVTNAKFTNQVIRYAKCIGEMDLLGWRYPKPKGLEYLIESRKLYPVTILPSFSSSFLEGFEKEKIMLAGDILALGREKLLEKTGLSFSKIDSLIKEAQTLLCQ